jgi:tricorn protease
VFHKTALLLLSIGAFSFGQTLPEGRLMRFPDLHGDKIAFSYGGDLWLASREGGVARRITSHPGQELFPKFSPDGKWIAFTGQYDGNYNVYIIPSEGGAPKQLTFHPGGGPLSERMGIHNEVINWFPDSKRILFLSRRDTFNTWFGRLYSVSIDGGLPEPLPLPKGGLTSFSPDGNRIAYNQIFRNFRTWKRYQGGMAQDISIYDFKTNEIQQVPHEDWTDTFPMWHGDTIYFDSDRGPEHRLNLYSYSVQSRKVRQLTHFTDFDVNWPSLGPDAIIFENGGYLYLFDLKSEKPRKLTVYLPGDMDWARKRWVNVSPLITDFDLSPDGKRAVFSARGDVFTVPAKEGSIRQITRTPGIREKYVAWSPDGRWIAYMSDRSGGDELYIAPQDGAGSEVQLTTGGAPFRMPPLWSPDSRKIAYADKDLRLFYVDINDKKPVEIDRGEYGEITDYDWSPDSKWVAYAKAVQNTYSVVYMYSTAGRNSTAVTTDFYDSRNPWFDPEGKYLYFLSNRDFNEVLGNYDFEFANPKTTRIYVVTLRRDLPSPFPVLSDEVKIKSPDELVTPTAPSAKEEPKKAEAKPKTTAEAKTPAPAAAEFRIDLDGIGNRIVALPIPPGNLRGLNAAKGLVFYAALPTQGLSGPLPGEAPSIHVFDLQERKDHVLIEQADNFALSSDGTKLLYSAPRPGPVAEGEPPARQYGIIDARPPEKEPHKVGEGALNLAEMRTELDPREEWKQIFHEVWLQQSAYFYEASMNGVDWAKVRDKYAQLLPYVADRLSLTYVLGEMIGELANSHTYVGGGDYPDLKPVNVGLLGTDFTVDKANNLYRLGKIYRGENWQPDLRSPLTEPGVVVKEGEYLLAVNGRPLHADQNPYELFINTVNQNVTLTVNDKPSQEGARSVVVRPIPSEYGLHELNWIDENRRKVEAASGGRIGYVYLPDMSAAGLNQFVRQYFPQIRKEGMIFDVRYNGGGFVDQLIFERLRRTVVGMTSARNWKSDTIPPNTFYGHMACVTNHYAASDGDFFTYFFKQYKLGPVIGERTWGGVRGIRGEMPLIDGGYITRPEFALYSMDSKWVIENRGVEPDITVENRPDLVVKGRDPQLEKAIELVMQEIKAHPKRLPERPADLPAYPAGPGD